MLSLNSFASLQPYNGTGVVIYDALPSDRSHALHYLRADPSKRNLYVPHGTPCNICETPKPVNNGTIHYAAMHVLNLQTRQMSLYATGIRNSVGFDWHPDTGVFYFTDNGRDQMGENTPDCELNMAPKSGECRLQHLLIHQTMLHKWDMCAVSYNAGHQHCQYEVFASYLVYAVGWVAVLCCSFIFLTQ